MKQRIPNDDRGFSLIELIVVVLIIGILATAASLSFSIVYNSDVNRAARKFTNVMKVARTKAIALDDTDSQIIVKITLKNGNYCAGVFKRPNSGGSDVEIDEEETIAKYRVNLEVGGKKGSTDRITIDETHPLVYYFKKSTGGIIEENINGTSYGTFDPGDGSTKYDEDLLFRDLTFKGTGSESTVIIIPATGKSYVD